MTRTANAGEIAFNHPQGRVHIYRHDVVYVDGWLAVADVLRLADRVVRNVSVAGLAPAIVVAASLGRRPIVFPSVSVQDRVLRAPNRLSGFHFDLRIASRPITNAGRAIGQTVFLSNSSSSSSKRCISASFDPKISWNFLLLIARLGPYTWVATARVREIPPGPEGGTARWCQGQQGNTRA